MQIQNLIQRLNVFTWFRTKFRTKNPHYLKLVAFYDRDSSPFEGTVISRTKCNNIEFVKRALRILVRYDSTLDAFGQYVQNPIKLYSIIYGKVSVTTIDCVNAKNLLLLLKTTKRKKPRDLFGIDENFLWLVGDLVVAKTKTISSHPHLTFYTDDREEGRRIYNGLKKLV